MSAGWFIAGAVLGSGSKRETKRRVKNECKINATLDGKAAKKEARKEARKPFVNAARAESSAWTAASLPGDPVPNGPAAAGDELRRLTKVVSDRLAEERKLRTASKELCTA